MSNMINEFFDSIADWGTDLEGRGWLWIIIGLVIILFIFLIFNKLI